MLQSMPPKITSNFFLLVTSVKLLQSNCEKKFIKVGKVERIPIKVFVAPK
jgi:hypothetical protein